MAPSCLCLLAVMATSSARTPPMNTIAVSYSVVVVVVVVVVVMVALCNRADHYSFAL